MWQQASFRGHSAGSSAVADPLPSNLNWLCLAPIFYGIPAFCEIFSCFSCAGCVSSAGCFLQMSSHSVLPQRTMPRASQIRYPLTLFSWSGRHNQPVIAVFCSHFSFGGKHQSLGLVFDPLTQAPDRHLRECHLFEDIDSGPGIFAGTRL